MNTLVTGSSGFIGSVLVESLVKRGHHVSAFDHWPGSHSPSVNVLPGDIRSLEEIQSAARGQDIVYHLAGVLGSHEMVGNAAYSVDVNVKGTINVLEACRVHGARMLLVSKPNVWLNTYSITKQAAEQFSKMYMREHDVSATIVKWYNAYGPGQKVGPGHVQKAIPTFIVNALEQKPLPVFGDGRQTADFIHVDDLVEATVSVAESPAARGLTVQVGTGIETSMLRLCEMILEMTGSSSEIEMQPMRPGESPNTELRADLTLLKETTDFVPQIRLETGLMKTIEWYRERPSPVPHVGAASPYASSGTGAMRDTISPTNGSSLLDPMPPAAS